jgi:3-oxoadipate enol-lactonase
MPKIVTDDGVQLNYRLEDLRDPWAGEPETTVLMHHGFAKNLEWWTPCVAAIARRYRVVRYDARGCGKSSVPPAGAEWSLARLAKDAVNVTDALGIKKVHFVSFESGGVVGLYFAANYPDRIKSLAMFNTPNPSWMSAGRMNRHFSCGYANEVEAIDALGLENWISRTLPIHVDGTADPALIGWVKAKVASTPLAVVKSWFKVMEKTDLASLPPRVQVPTLFVAGGDHNFGCEAPLLDELKAQIPLARDVVYVPGVASSVQLMAPDACASALLDFLGSLEGPSRARNRTA